MKNKSIILLIILTSSIAINLDGNLLSINIEIPYDNLRSIITQII